MSQTPAPSDSHSRALPAEPNADPSSDWIVVGRVMGAWGVKGSIKVQPYSSDPVALTASNVWRLQRATATVPNANSSHDVAAAPARQEFTVLSCRFQGGHHLVAQLEGLSVPELAQTWRGSEISVPRAAFPAPADNEFYWVDLIGCQVINAEQQVLGVVSDLLDSPAHSLLMVQPAAVEAASLLIPFVDAHVLKVDLASRRIHVEWSDAL